MSDLSATPGHAPDANYGTQQYERGVDFMLGRGVAADLGHAAAAFLNAADADEPRGLYAAGMMYLKGIGVSANLDTGAGYLNRSAALGHGPAKKVLLAMKQGKDIAAFPIVVASGSSATSTPGGTSGTQPASGQRVTPARVLAVMATVVLVVAGSGTGFWLWSKHKANEQVALAAEQKRAAEEQRRREDEARQAVAAAEAERQRIASAAQAELEKAAAALREVEAEKQRLAEQQNEIATKMAALPQREQVQAAPQSPATKEEVASATAGVETDWNAMLKAAAPHWRTMMDAALANRPEAVVNSSGAIRALPQPPRGDRKLARAKNQQGLDALKRQDMPAAVALFDAAMTADAADEEVATNLGFALIRAGRETDAKTPLMRALYLNPGRSSAWYNLGLSYVGENKEQSAYAAFLLTYQFASSQQKSQDWFQRVAQDESAKPMLRRLAQRLLASPAVAGVGTTTPAPVLAATAATPPSPASAVPSKPGFVQTVAQAGAAPDLVSVQEACRSKNNPVSRSLCESHLCSKPEYASHRSCNAYQHRTSIN